MPDWQITNVATGATSTFPALGIAAPRRSLTNAGRDRFTFIADGRAHDADSLFAFGNRLRIIHPNGTGWFQGTVTTLPRYTSGPGERQSYEISGPMYQLEQNVFKLVWPGVDVLYYTSHILLHYAGIGEIEFTRVTVSRILDYVLSLYPVGAKPFQYAHADILPGVDADVQPPIDEVRDILCSEALRRCMRWHPRSVLWFDYSVSPPAFKLTPQDHLTAVSFAGGTGLPASKVSEMELSPRHDLIRPSVAITYEIRSEVNGVNVLTFQRDIAPVGATGLEEGCRNLSLDLRGLTRQVTSVFVETTDILTNDIEWWKGHIPLLKNSTVFKNLTIKAGSVTRMGSRENGVEVDSRNLPYEVTSKGQFPPWLKNQGSNDVQRERIRAIFTYDIYANDGTTILEHGELLKSVSITATNVETGTYSTLTDTESSDPIPEGLAQKLYDEIKDLQWDAAFTFTDQEVGGTVAPGKIVNITGSRAEFATMDAIVQSVDEDIASGLSTAKCGPLPPHEPADILELIRVTRPRIRWTAPKAFDDGDVSEGVELGEETADENGVIAAARETLKTIRDETSGKSVTLDAGKGANGAASPANATTGQTAGAAHIKIDSGLGKTFQGNASDGIIYHANGTNVLNAKLADISGQGPITYQKEKVCRTIGGVVKQRTRVFLCGPVFKDTDDPT